MRLIISIGFLLCVTNSHAQNVKGNWFGNADVLLGGSHNNYLVELNLKQKSRNEIHGVLSYYFKNSFQTFYVHGTYDVDSREINIRNVPITYFRASASGGVECPMDLKAILTISRVSSNLKGVFTSQEKYKYTCPDIAFDFVYGDQSLDADSLIDKFTAIRKIWRPSAEDFVVSAIPKPEPPKDQTDTATAKALSDSVASLPNSIASIAPASVELKKEDTVAAVPNDVKKIIADFARRKEVLSKEVLVQSDSIRITLYDNGIVDGDSISVFYNKAPVAIHQGLSERGINLYVAIDSSRAYDEITMFAENLGRIPPNTALMVITDGLNRYEVFMSSSFTQNSTVRIKRKR